MKVLENEVRRIIMGQKQKRIRQEERQDLAEEQEMIQLYWKLGSNRQPGDSRQGGYIRIAGLSSSRSSSVIIISSSSSSSSGSSMLVVVVVVEVVVVEAG